jgi:hypothetical protein
MLFPSRHPADPVLHVIARYSGLEVVPVIPPVGRNLVAIGVAGAW